MRLPFDRDASLPVPLGRRSCDILQSLDDRASLEVCHEYWGLVSIESVMILNGYGLLSLNKNFALAWPRVQGTCECKGNGEFSRQGSKPRVQTF